MRHGLSSTSKTRGSVLIYVQHLLGTGHLRRMALVANACAKRGLQVTIISGGFAVRDLPLHKVDIVQLEAIRSADASFNKLVASNGEDVSESTWMMRHDQLETCVGKTRPSVLLVESYPFARRKMRREIVSLIKYLKQKKPDAKVLCSVRDVLQYKTKMKRRLETVDVFNKYFDALLVHSDPTLVELENSFPEVLKLKHPVHYTGFVANKISEQLLALKSSGEILVSAGGGTAAGNLFQTAIDVSLMPEFANNNWRLLISREIEQHEFDKLRFKAGENVVVERTRTDYVKLLAAAKISITQAGYNTVMELLQTSTRSILIPFEYEGETEQLTRARLLSESGRAVLLRESELSPDALAKAVQQSLLGSSFEGFCPDINGAEASAKLIESYTAQPATSM